MSLHRDDWLKQAQRLAVGQKKRVRHGFEATAALDVYNNADSWSAYCHRCHEAGRVMKVHQSILRPVQEPDRVAPVPATVMRFADATQYEQQRMWRLLCDKGCPPGVIPEELLWYERSVNRLMLLQGGQALGRALDRWRMPKWLPYGAWHGKPMVWQTRMPVKATELAPGVRQAWAIAEDALSAYKIAKAMEAHWPNSPVGAMATLGTSVTTASLPYMAGTDVACMYDGDAAGLSGFLAMRKRLNVFGGFTKDARPVKGDPKNMTLEHIAERLEDVFGATRLSGA